MRSKIFLPYNQDQDLENLVKEPLKIETGWEAEMLYPRMKEGQFAWFSAPTARRGCYLVGSRKQYLEWLLKQIQTTGNLPNPMNEYYVYPLALYCQLRIKNYYPLPFHITLPGIKSGCCAHESDFHLLYKVVTGNNKQFPIGKCLYKSYCDYFDIAYPRYWVDNSHLLQIKTEPNFLDYLFDDPIQFLSAMLKD